MYFFHRSRDQERSKDEDFSEIRRDFLAWLKERRFHEDQNKYLIDGAVCVDYFIRFESLHDDLMETCRRLKIERGVAELQRLKADSRLTDNHFSEFYDREAQGIVAQSYAFEMDYFGYRLFE
jgi:hypothetical protein